MRILAADHVATDWRLAGHLMATPRRNLDLLDQPLDSIAMDRRLLRSPTGKRTEGELLALDEGFRIEEKTLAPGLGLERSVLPPTRNDCAFGERPGAVDSGPVEWRGDESLFDSMRQHISQPVDLGLLLVRNEDRLISAPPELLSPAHQPTCLPSEVRVEIGHEGGQLLGVGDAHEEVIVIREEDVGMDLDGVEARGASEHAESGLAQNGRRSQEQATLDRATGDLDQRPAGRHEA